MRLNTNFCQGTNQYLSAVEVSDKVSVPALGLRMGCVTAVCNARVSGFGNYRELARDQRARAATTY
jgi:hypothetical protein